MNTKKLTDSADEKELLSRIYDLARRAQGRGRYEFSAFLTPAERAVIERDTALKSICEISFDGAYEGALRTVAVMRPFGCDYEQAPPLAVLNLEYVWSAPSNRDILGALMGLGIKRNLIGDIADSANPPFIVCLEKIADYLCENFTQAGRNKIKTSRGEIVEPPQENGEEKLINVASARLDCIISGVFSLPRKTASTLIESGLTQKNYLVVTSVSAQVDEGDTLSLRGYGKARILSFEGLSRKGRTFVRVKILK